MEKTPIPIAIQSGLEEKINGSFEKPSLGKNARRTAPIEISNKTFLDSIKNFGNLLEAKYLQDMILIQQNYELLTELKTYNEQKKSEQYTTTNLKL